MKRKTYSMEDMAPIVVGDVELPNWKAMDVELMCNDIAARGHMLLPHWGYARLNGSKQWAQFFLFPTPMGNAHAGSFDGSGYAIIYGRTAPVTGAWAICRHEFQSDAGADHNRGWHPGRCVKCGMDMTVDSGD